MSAFSNVWRFMRYGTTNNFVERNISYKIPENTLHDIVLLLGDGDFDSEDLWTIKSDGNSSARSNLRQITENNGRNSVRMGR